MTLYLLTNAGAEAATSVEAVVGGDISSGYDAIDMITGPRSRLVRLDASASEQGRGYVLAADLIINYAVIARADLMLTADTSFLHLDHRNAAGNWVYNANFNGGAGETAFTSASLTGPYSQDAIIAVTTDASYRRGYGWSTQTKGAGTEAAMISKFIAASAFDFGINPAAGVRISPVGDDERFFIPLRSTLTYETEQRIEFSVQCTYAKVASFKALPQILAWPLYLYDDTGDLLPWYLEHVLLEKYEEVRSNNEMSRLDLSFLRLKHYP